MARSVIATLTLRSLAIESHVLSHEARVEEEFFKVRNSVGSETKDVSNAHRPVVINLGKRVCHATSSR